MTANLHIAFVTMPSNYPVMWGQRSSRSKFTDPFASIIIILQVEAQQNLRPYDPVMIMQAISGPLMVFERLAKYYRIIQHLGRSYTVFPKCPHANKWLALCRKAGKVLYVLRGAPFTQLPCGQRARFLFSVGRDATLLLQPLTTYSISFRHKNVTSHPARGETRPKSGYIRLHIPYRAKVSREKIFANSRVDYDSQKYSPRYFVLTLCLYIGWLTQTDDGIVACNYTPQQIQFSCSRSEGTVPGARDLITESLLLQLCCQ